MELDELIKDLDDKLGIRAIARKHSVTESKIRHMIKKAGLMKEEDQEAKHLVKGKSTLFDSQGNIKLEWIKTHVKEQSAIEQFQEAISSIISNKDILSPITIPCPFDTLNDLLSVYTIGDAHVGMLAWDKETGADNDLQTVQDDLRGAMALLVQKSDYTKDALIVDVGDWFHSDNSSNTTSKSGNILDVDGRYPKVLEAGMMLAINLIDLALQKHARVTWRSAIGNHNEHSAIMMTAFIKAWYRKEDRVTVADTPNMFYYHIWGKNLIGITHGHTVKAEKLGEIMSVDCEDKWSASKYRYWYTGHIHHQSVKEFPSCVVETFRTLAGKDAWHSASGYRSGQDMKCITLHKDYGEIDRATVSLRMVRNG